MRRLNKIIIHHSGSNFGNAKTIENQRKKQGKKGVGYHFVIYNKYYTEEDLKNNYNDIHRRNLQQCLNIEDIGDHTKGHNRNSIGVCLIHLDIEYPEVQLYVFRNLVASLCYDLGIDVSNVLGHYEIDSKESSCPGLDMDKERKFIKEKLNSLILEGEDN